MLRNNLFLRILAEFVFQETSEKYENLVKNQGLYNENKKNTQLNWQDLTLH